MVLVPPGGFAGFSQMTPASKARLSQFRGSRGPTRRRKKRKATTSRKRKSTRRKSVKRTTGQRMKFGSPAWQKKYKVGKYKK
jgi:hypothetical protein